MSDDLTPAQLGEIEAAAKKATPGEWVHDEDGEVRGSNGESLFFGDAAGYGLPLSRAIAEHVAMMDPATTLALVAEVRELRAKVERVRELHNADGERMTGSPRATGWEDYCTHCQRAAPCPTVRALDLFKALGEEA